jgi:hypothetical protein
VIEHAKPGVRRPGEEDARAPAAAPAPEHPVLALQAGLGNAATARLLRQMATPEQPMHCVDPADLVSVAQGPGSTPALDSGPAAPAPPVCIPSDVPPEIRKRILWARTTLSRVSPLADHDESVLRKLLPATPLLHLITERDAARDRVAELARKVESVTSGWTDTNDPSGQPRDLGNVAEVEHLDREREELQRLHDAVYDALDALGVKDEEQLTHLIEERFPQIFLSRASDVAHAILDENESIVLAEARRLGTDSAFRDLYGIAREEGADAAIADMRKAATELADLYEAGHKIRDEELALDATLGQANNQMLEDEGYDWRIDEGPANEVGPRIHPGYKAVQEKYAQHSAVTHKRRDELGLLYPLLLRTHEYKKLALMSDAELREFSGGEILEILENIEETRENIRDGDLKLWDLRDVFDMTMQDLSIAPESPLFVAVQQHVGEEKTDETILDIALTAIGLVAAVLAALPSAGTSLVIAGTAVATTVGVAQLSKSLGRYAAEQSASNVALDPRVADISVKSPDMWAVALDVVALGLDAGGVVRVVSMLSSPIRLARATGDVAQLARAIDDLMPAIGQDGADRVMRTVARESDVQRAIVQVVDAETELMKVGQDGLTRGFQELVDAGRVRPLNEDALYEVFGDAAENMITNQRVLTWEGFYNPANDYLFVREGSINALSGGVIHEVVHRMQVQLRPQMTRFMQEFESFAAQRSYLQRLIADGVDPGVAFPAHRWLAEASDEAITRHIVTTYGIPAPADFDYAQAVLEAIGGLGRI